MKRKILLPVLSVFMGLLMTNCASDDPEPSVSNLEYQFYSMFLDSDYAYWENVIVFAESYSGLGRFTLSESYLDNVDQANPSIGRLLLDELLIADRDSVIYENRFVSESKVVSIETTEALREVFLPGASYQESWQNFFDTYGEESMLVAFTRVAFNETGDKAVYGVGKQRMGADHGYIVYLEKVESEWLIKDIVETWIA